MLRFAIIILCAALVAIFLGFGGVSLGAKILFFIFLTVALFAFLGGKNPRQDLK